jgi:N-acyl-D-aspartate/D-glutamate deacylase
MFDVLIRNGKVVDGSGKTPFTGDVGVEGDRITLVGKANGAQARTEIDAAGRVVCPGFVDSHSHADLTVHRTDHDKMLAPLVKQGITTFIGGNCGMSMAPLGGVNAAAVRQYIEVFTGFDISQDCSWNTMGQFLDTLDERGVLLNTAVLAPHGLIRLDAMGMARRFATDDELEGMAHALDQCLEEGAIGLSTGLQYYPGSQSDTREMQRMGQVLKKHDAVFTCHLRSYSATLARAVDEVLDVSRENGIRGQISHLFWIPDYGPAGPAVRAVIRQLSKVPERWMPPIPLDGPIAQRIEQVMKSNAAGTGVAIDIMPTTTGFTHLLAFFPPWVLEGSTADVIARMRDPEARRRMKHSIEHGNMKWPHVEGDSWSMNFFKVMGWECSTVMAVVTEKNKRYEGMNIAEIAREQHKHPLDAACDLLLDEDGHVLVFETMGEPDSAMAERSTFAALKHPETFISTDTILMGIGRPSYLFHGCYPKFLGRYVREKRMLPLETAMRKITSLPAGHFGLKDRGKIAQGAFADIVVFDEATIASGADFHKPDQPPIGIDHVFINGQMVVDHGTVNANPRAGKVLRSGN